MNSVDQMATAKLRKTYRTLQYLLRAKSILKSYEVKDTKYFQMSHAGTNISLKYHETKKIRSF